MTTTSTASIMSSSISSATSSSSSCLPQVIAGDFNAHDPTWDAIQNQDSRGSDLLELTEGWNLSIHNDPNKPTRRPFSSQQRHASPDVTVSCRCSATDWRTDATCITNSTRTACIYTCIHTVISHPSSGNMQMQHKKLGRGNRTEDETTTSTDDAFNIYRCRVYDD